MIKQAGKNIAYNLIGQFFLLLLSLFAIKYIYQYLGGEALGILVFAMVLSGLLNTALGAGLRPMIIREYASNEKSVSYTIKLIQSSSFVLWGLFLLAAAIVLGCIPLIVEHWLNLNTMNSESVERFLLILTLSSLLTIPANIYFGLLEGAQRMGTANAAQVGISALKNGGILFILTQSSLSSPLDSVAYWVAVSQCLQIILLIFISLQIISLRALIPVPSLHIFIKNKSFALNTMYVSSLSVVHAGFDKLVISKLLQAVELGYYNTVTVILDKVVVFARAVSNAMYPIFCQHHANKDQESLLLYYHRYQDCICYAGTTVLAMAVFFHQPLLAFIFDPEIADSLLHLFIILIFAYLIQLLFVLPHSIFLAKGKAAIISKFSTINLMATIPISILAIYQFGLEGGGAAFFATRILNLILIIPSFSRECLGREVVEWYQWALSLMGTAMLSYGLIYSLVLYFHIDNLGILSLYFIISTLIFNFTAWKFSLPQESKNFVMSGINRIFSGRPCKNDIIF